MKLIKEKCSMCRVFTTLYPFSSVCEDCSKKLCSGMSAKEFYDSVQPAQPVENQAVKTFKAMAIIAIGLFIVHQGQDILSHWHKSDVQLQYESLLNDTDNKDPDRQGELFRLKKTLESL
jgi:hypothetical protein